MGAAVEAVEGLSSSGLVIMAGVEMIMGGVAMIMAAAEMTMGEDPSLGEVAGVAPALEITEVVDFIVI